MSVEEISKSDPRVGKPNTFCPTIDSSKSKIVVSRSGVCVVPTEYIPKSHFATVTLTSEDMMKFLGQNPLAVICKSNTKESSIGVTRQRVPVKDRRDKIRLAWKDAQRVPQGKVETVNISLNNVKITRKGIMLTKDSLAAVTDGCGRVTAFYDEISELDEDMKSDLFDRCILWQLNFNFSNTASDAACQFILENRDQKRASNGTNLSVEIGLIEDFRKEGREIPNKDYGDSLTRAWIIAELYQYPVNKSMTELMPWSYEGVKSRHEGFRGIGKATGIHTSLTKLAKHCKSSQIEPDEMPKFLNFAFRVWYKQSPNAVIDAHSCAIKTRKGEEKFKSKCHFHSTLAVKAIMYVSLRAYTISGMEEKAFVESCRKIIQEYFRLYKEDFFLGGKSAKRNMNIDDFWMHNKYFCDEMFNSGETNSTQLLKRLKIAADNVIIPRKAA